MDGYVCFLEKVLKYNEKIKDSVNKKESDKILLYCNKIDLYANMIIGNIKTNDKRINGKFVCDFESYDKNMITDNDDDRYSPYISMADPKELNMLTDPDEIIIYKEKIFMEYDYPLKKSFYFKEMAPNGKYFTRKDLGKIISDRYKQMYDEEAKTTTIPIGTMAVNIVNRNETNGTYGIWMHGIEDLLLHTIYYNARKDTYYIDLDS